MGYSLFGNELLSFEAAMLETHRPRDTILRIGFGMGRALQETLFLSDLEITILLELIVLLLFVVLLLYKAFSRYSYKL